MNITALDKELEALSDGTIDERVKNISNEEFLKSIADCDERLDVELDKINQKRTRDLKEALSDIHAYV